MLFRAKFALECKVRNNTFWKMSNTAIAKVAKIVFFQGVRTIYEVEIISETISHKTCQEYFGIFWNSWFCSFVLFNIQIFIIFNCVQFQCFPKMFLFPKILTLKLFGNLWRNSYNETLVIRILWGIAVWKKNYTRLFYLQNQPLGNIPGKMCSRNFKKQ